MCPMEEYRREAMQSQVDCCQSCQRGPRSQLGEEVFVKARDGFAVLEKEVVEGSVLAIELCFDSEGV